ncbi:MAG: transposase, partial [Methylococcales bacterium]
HVDETLVEEVRLTVNKGLVLGNERFKAEIESLTGRRMKAKSMGRPLGWRKEMPCDI